MTKTPIKYLGLKAAAAHVGIAPGTASAYIARGYFADPDAIILEGKQESRGWLPETLDHWKANRPGRGKRTDLDTRKNWRNPNQ